MDDLSQLDFSTGFASNADSKPKGNGKTNFDFISQMQPSSNSSSRSPSPFAVRPPQPSSRPSLPSATSSSSTSRLNPSSASTGRGADAFSDLFSASPTSSQSGTQSGLSMAERLDKENAARLGTNSNLSPYGGAASWRPLSPASTGGSGSSRGVSPSLPTLPSRSSSSNRGAPIPSTHVSAPKPSTWDFDLLASSTSTSTSLPPPSSRPLPLDSFSLDFDSTSYKATSSTVAPPSPGFDLLGVLAAPLPSHPSPSPSPIPSRAQTPQSRSSPAPRSSNNARNLNNASPPPHILGQIVEMGFSVEQAKVSLVATKTDDGSWDVAAALEAIVLEEETEMIRKNELSRRPEEEDEEAAGLNGRRERSRRRSWEDEVDTVLPPRAPVPAAPVGRRAREAAAAAAASASSRGRDDATGPSSTKVQEQAADILAQASKIGLNVFKSANAYWESSRANIAKKLEETLAAEGDETAPRRNGGKSKDTGRVRPKWMTEDMEVDDLEPVPHRTREHSRGEESSSRAQGKHREREELPPPLFQDDDDDHDDDEDPQDVPESVLPQRPVARKPEPIRPRPSEPSPISSEPAKDYRSPFRRRNPVDSAPSPASLPATAPASKATPTRPPPAQAVSKPIRPPRPVVDATPSQLSQSITHKTKGNELFKLGRFGDAEQAYGFAIASLPSGHLSLIPLFNNRATARLKVGDEKGAIEDSTKVVNLVLGPIGVVGGRVDIAVLDEENSHLIGGEVNLREQLGKALGKRAKANEGVEKWKNAQDDWSALMTGGESFASAAGGTKLVSEGLVRCRKMLGQTSTTNATSLPASSTIPKRPPPPPPPSASVKPNSDAVRALRTANAAADAEDDLRLSLKDAVDSRITAWKAGKETNLRALIASLDSVLWKELGWIKVGLHELVTDGQLKVRYVKAIAKLHPDKLAVGETSVEQRMIAGLVFSALNDAWVAHQSQRK